MWDKGSRFYKLGQSMDKIGWRRYMEVMILSEALVIHTECVDLGGCSLSMDNWEKGLAITLLEATHGQWIYRNMLVHDTVSGLKAVEWKEELQREIEDQIELGGSGLDEQDRYLLEIKLEDLETSTGGDQYYWLIAIRAARADRILKRRQQESVTGDLGGCSLSMDNWEKGLAIKLLEATHGQWIYRNMLVHDTVSGLKAAERKEELQR